MPKCMRSEARALLTWCLEQRKPFSRGDAAKALNRDLASVAKQFKRFELLGFLEHEIDVKGHYSYMVRNSQAAQEATEQRPMSPSATERQRRSRLRKTGTRMVNSVWALGL